MRRQRSAQTAIEISVDGVPFVTTDAVTNAILLGSQEVKEEMSQEVSNASRIASSVVCPKCMRWQMFWYGRTTLCRACGQPLERKA